jgi:hypothetical protein
MLTRRSLIRAAGLAGGMPFAAKAGLLLSPTSGGGGGGTYALVSHTTAETSGGTITTPSINTTGATLLLLGVAGFNQSAAWTITDNKGNNTAWASGLAVASPTPYTSNNSTATLWFVRGGSVGSGHTFTVTAVAGGGGAQSIYAAAFSGGNVSPLDQVNRSSAGPVTTNGPGSITPTTANQLVVAVLGLNSSSAILGSSIAIDSGYTITDAADTGASTIFGGALAYKIQTSALATSPTWTWSLGASSFCVIASFK